jgi:hypothetical protein
LKIPFPTPIIYERDLPSGKTIFLILNEKKANLKFNMCTHDVGDYGGFE